MEAKEESGPYTIFILAVSIFAILAMSARAFLEINPDTQTILEYADDGICILFFLDFLISFMKAENKAGYFFKWGWIDLLSSIPMVDSLRWGRLARIMRIFRVLRGFRSAKILGAFIVNRRAEGSFLAAVLITILLIVISSISILQFESAPESNIKSADDALWWSMTTITTVGYGDKYPVTPEGRLIASMLMLSGLGLFGTLSGFVASWFLQPKKEEKDTEIQELVAEVKLLRSELSSLKCNQKA